MRYIYLFVLLAFFSCGIKEISLTPIQTYFVKGELSGITYFNSSQQFIVVDDGGKVLFLDSNFNKKEKIKLKKRDLEGICIYKNTLYVLDEDKAEIVTLQSHGNLFSIQDTVELKQTLKINKGYEGITYNNIKKQFVLVTESDPCSIHFYDTHFNLIKELPYRDVKDLSDILFYKNKYFLLSDIDQRIIVTDTNFKTLEIWLLPIINPEGLHIKDNLLFVVSDKEQKVYAFKLPS